MSENIFVRKSGLGLFGLIVALVLFVGCGGKQQKRPDEMGFAELRIRALELIEKKKHDLAIVHLEQLVSQYPENQDIFEYKFMLADLYLKVGRLAAAHEMYKRYNRLYPSEARAEEAQYKSILSRFYQTLKISRNCDDTDAQETVKQCALYLDNNGYKRYRSDVEDIKNTCEQRLIDKEVYVFNTYLRRKKYQSAQNRINYLKETYLSSHPSLEAQVLYLESKLAYKQKNHGVVKERIESLSTKYPESRFTKMAHSMVSRKNREFKF